MPTKTYIESSLRSINDSDFQNLIIRFLMFRGYEFVSAPGAMDSKNKTTKGTPDALFHGLNRNKYVLCEITTQNKNDNKNKFMEKLKEDIDHCFDYEKTNIENSKVDEVILACNSKVDAKEYEELRKYIAQKYKNDNLRIYSIQNLAEELISFPDIDEFFQNISFLDGISTLEGFIENSKRGIRPDLKNNYLKQSDTFDTILSTLEKESILLIYGNQGIGKTRLAIELAKEFNNQNYTTLVVNYYDNNLKDNLYKILQKNNKYLIIFDNYIQYDSIDYLIKRIPQIFNKSEFKFIFTLRQPYLIDLEKQLSDFNTKKIQLNEVSREFMETFINELLKEYGFNIKKSYIDKIIDLSKNNIGFALMILLPLFEHDDYSYLINPEKAYENYFKNYKSFEAVLSNEASLKVLGCVSFFDKIDLNNENLVSTVYDIFKIDFNENEDIILKLTKNELLSKKGNILEFSDSILSTYIFYHTFISQNILSFEDLILNFIDNYSTVINNKIYEVIIAFGFEDFKNKKFQTLLKIESQLKNEKLISFYNIFHIYFEIQILNFVNEWIDSESDEYFDVNKFEIPDMHNYHNYNRIIKLSAHLLYSQYDTLTLKLFVEIIYKKPSLTKEVFYHLKETYSYSINSLQNKYLYQNKLMDFIEIELENPDKELIKKTIFVFLLNENRMFDWHHNELQQTSNHKVNIYRIKLPNTTELSEFRLRLLNYLLKIYDDYKRSVEKNLNSYIRLMSVEYSNLIFNEEHILKKFFNKMDFKRYYPNKLSYTYYNKLTGIYYDKFKMYTPYFPNFYDYVNVESIDKINTLSKIFNDYDDFNPDEKIKKIENYLMENQNYIEFFDLLKEVNESGDGYFNVDYLFAALIRFDENLFIEAFEYYCWNNYTLFKSKGFINEIFEYSNLNAIEIYELLNKNSYDDLENCNDVFFKVIPKNQIDEFIFYKLIIHIKTSNNFIFLPEKYINYEPTFIRLKNKLNTETRNIVQFLTEIIVNKDYNSPFVFSHSFCKKYQHYFEDNFELLKNAYFTKISLEMDLDHNFEELKVLCELDKNVLKEYFEWRFEHNDEFYKDDSQMNFIWNLNYNFEELSSLIEYIIENSKDFDCQGVSLLFTGKTLKEKEFIKEFIEKNHQNKKSIEVLFTNIKKYYSHEEYLEFLEIFLRWSKDFEIFKSIIRPDFYMRNLFSEEGDIKLRLDFYNKIKDKLFDLNSVDHIKHMKLIENEINDVEQELKKFYKYSPDSKI